MCLPPQVQAPQQPQGGEYEELVGAWRAPDGVDEERMELAEWIKQCSNFLNNIEVRTIGTEFSPDPLGWMMRKCIDMRVRNLRQPVPGEATEDNEDNENNDCSDNLFANETLVVTYYRNSS